MKMKGLYRRYWNLGTLENHSCRSITEATWASSLPTVVYQIRTIDGTSDHGFRFAVKRIFVYVNNILIYRKYGFLRSNFSKRVVIFLERHATEMLASTPSGMSS